MTFEEAEAKGYKQIACQECNGYGVVSDYHDNDFHGAKDCPRCQGNAMHWVTPHGRHVRYPGGPFC